MSIQWALAVALVLAGAEGLAQAPSGPLQSRLIERVQVHPAGWSARGKILGRPVYNERGDLIGQIDDLIVAPDSSASFAIVSTGNFVGLRRHRVALPVGMLLHTAGGFYLSGASKQALLKWPAFADGQPVPPPPSESEILVRE